MSTINNFSKLPASKSSAVFCYFHRKGFLATILANLLCILFLANSAWALDSDESITENFTTVYLVRHAEKELDSGKDPELTKQGRFRAANLIKFFKYIALDAVYSTDTKRTRNTASPVAESQSQQIQIYDARAIDHARFLENNMGKTVLVVGHSNTIPAFANALLGKHKYEDLDETEYDDLFVVDILGQQRSARRLVVRVRLEAGNSQN